MGPTNIHLFFHFFFYEMPFTKIEVKHIYQNSSHYAAANSFLPLIWSNASNLTFTSPNNVLQATANVKAWTLPVPQQGTNDDQRVGNKITPQSYHCDIFIAPKDFNDYLPNFFNKLFLTGGGIQSQTNYMLTKSKYYMRLMVIDFYNDDRFSLPDQFVNNIEQSADSDEYNSVMQELNKWYRITYVPTGGVNPANVSCSQKMLRESTVYTGTFRILHDRLIKLSPKNHFSKRVSLDLDMQRYKDFNITDDRYTKHNILVCLFNCMAPTLDMDPCLYKLLNQAYTEDNTQDKTNYRNTYSLSIGFTGKLRYLDF